MDLKGYLLDKRAIINQALKDVLPEPRGSAAKVIEAMGYSLFAGGKRLRPILCLAGAEVVGGSATAVMPVACAIELIHTYSLIHDDLPLMDNDDLRRGKPTNHKVFGDALALLAGDGLLTEAFNMMTSVKLSEDLSPHLIISVIGLIARSAGFQGMVGGQVVDIQTEGHKINLSTLEFIHACKTGALITASVASGAILGGGSESEVKAITSYGKRIGQAFQIADDILDVEGDFRDLGKATGSDERKGKNTYPKLVGLERSKKLQKELVTDAIKMLAPLDHRADTLRAIALYIIERKK